MNQLPPVIRDQRKVDEEHVRLLALFHFVFAGLGLLGIAFLLMHYAFMHAIFMNPEMWKNEKGGPPPAVFFQIFKWVYLFGGMFFVMGAVLNLLSGMFLRRRKNRTFSIIVAALDCLQIPFGTALGVFTIMVLVRDSVRELYRN
jgi:hypothetical protein